MNRDPTLLVPVLMLTKRSIQPGYDRNLFAILETDLTESMEDRARKAKSLEEAIKLAKETLEGEEKRKLEGGKSKGRWFWK